MSETPTETLKPDTEEVETLRQRLKATDRLLTAKNAAIDRLESELASARKEKFEAGLEIDRLDSDLLDSDLAAHRSQLSDLKQNSAPIAIELPEPADLLNKLKGKRKKSKADLADIETILEILEEV